MSLYTRGKTPHLGKQVAQALDGNGLGGILEGNPLSYHYCSPRVGNSPKELTLYLVARQRSVYNNTILDQLDERILRRHVRLMLEKYQPQDIIRGIEIGLIYSQHPFSFSFVEKKALHGIRLRPDQEAGERSSDSSSLRNSKRSKYSMSMAQRTAPQLSAF